MASLVNQRRCSYKKGIDSESIRKRRENVSIQVRKHAKDQKLQQRRRLNHAFPSSVPTSTPKDNQQILATAAKRDVRRVATKIFSLDATKQLNGVTDIRQLLFNNPDSLVDTVVNLDLVPTLLELSEAVDNPPMQIQCAWALTKIASHPSHKNVCLSFIKTLCELLMTQNDDVSEQAIWSLGYLIRASPTLRSMVLDSGVMIAVLIVVKLNLQKKNILRTAMWTISSIFTSEYKPNSNLICTITEILRLVMEDVTDQETLIDACCTLLILSTSSEFVGKIIEYDICARLVNLLCHSCDKIQSPAIQIVANLLAESEDVTSNMLEYNFCPRFLALMKHPDVCIRRDVCWAISNLTAVSEVEVRVVIDAQLVPGLIHIALEDQFSARREAVWALSNAVRNGTVKHVTILVQHGCVSVFVKMLEALDADTVHLCLDALKIILYLKVVLVDDMDSLNMIQSLQYHPNKDIAMRASEVFDTT